MEQVPYLKILIVEDEETKICEWQDAIEHHNADLDNNKFLIEFIPAKSVPEAKEMIDRHRFDAAIIDLRLQVEQGISENNAHGNHLVQHILDAHPLGIIIYTGQSADANIPGYAKRQVKIVDKGDGIDPVIEWLKENKDVFLKLRGAKSAFYRETAKIFFNSIWPRWQYWTTNADDSNQLTDIVARHVVAHVHDALLSAGGDSTHPEETYFVPPLKSRLDTGDLIDYQGRTWIVVTPRCDLAHQGKVTTILLAACEDISEEWKKLTSNDSKTSKDRVGKLTQHTGSHKKHFLFPMMDLNSTSRGPWMVTFDELLGVPSEKAFEELTPIRFASLAPLFVPSLVERLGAYFSRIGTPGYSSE